ncbi:MAG: N-6 DNA methylase, partial [Nanoarchaeota archaeon]|nr:N-6 DNA methylase [Nanoarchaeota archaeon]
MTLKHVERSAVNQFLVIARDVIKSKKIRFGDILVDSREVSKDQAKAKYPDFVLLDTKNLRPLYIIEFKPPSWTPYEPVLVEDAHNKASKEGCKYFGTCNFNKVVIWRTDLEGVPLMERYLQEYDLVKMRTLDDISVKLVQTKLKKRLEEVLKNLEDIYYGRITVKKKAIDEFFIDMLRSAIDSFSVPIVDKIAEAYKLDSMFRDHLVGWFVEHGWTFQNNLESFEKVSKQYLLLLINKVLFYNTLKLHNPTLEELKFSSDEDASKFYGELNSYFNKVLEIDYESIYNSEFIDSVPIPSEVIPQLASFINSLSNKYDFSKVNYEIMGRIFENLIPQEERHKYGQFFTDSNVVDLINTFCIKDADANVLDSSCGAGTFLVRAYNLKKLMDTNQNHENIIKELFGFDLSKFASHLANINLSIKDLKANESYPRIINDDFFNIKPKDKFKDHQKAKNLSGALVDLEIPMMDAVVGNPPYTRQEELKQLFGDSYKDKLNALLDHEFQVKLNGTASVYAHFFVHGTAFLKNGGRFGYITANTWMDVAYGKAIQKFFLDNYRIIAIIDSKVERWFEYADVNTVIVILERCKDKIKRDNNIVRFVQLKDRFENFFPSLDSSENEDIMLKKEKRRLNSITKWIRKIEQTSVLMEDE